MFSVKTMSISHLYCDDLLQMLMQKSIMQIASKRSFVEILFETLCLLWFFSGHWQFAPSSPRACTPSSACTTGRRSTCSRLSAARYTSASSLRPSPSKRRTSSSSSCGLSSRMRWWGWSNTTDGPSLSTCTVLTLVRAQFCQSYLILKKGSLINLGSKCRLI